MDHLNIYAKMSLILRPCNLHSYYIASCIYGPGFFDQLLQRDPDAFHSLSPGDRLARFLDVVPTPRQVPPGSSSSRDAQGKDACTLPVGHVGPARLRPVRRRPLTAAEGGTATRGYCERPPRSRGAA